jgi:hypothetical protein
MQRNECGKERKNERKKEWKRDSESERERKRGTHQNCHAPSEPRTKYMDDHKNSIAVELAVHAKNKAAMQHQLKNSVTQVAVRMPTTQTDK